MDQTFACKTKTHKKRQRNPCYCLAIERSLGEAECNPENSISRRPLAAWVSHNALAQQHPCPQLIRPSLTVRFLQPLSTMVFPQGNTQHSAWSLYVIVCLAGCSPQSRDAQTLLIDHDVFTPRLLQAPITAGHMSATKIPMDEALASRHMRGTDRPERREVGKYINKFLCARHQDWHAPENFKTDE